MKVYIFIIPAVLAWSRVVQRRRLYSAVPGRVFIATRSHSAQGERELSLSKGDKVKGQICLHNVNMNLF